MSSVLGQQQQARSDGDSDSDWDDDDDFVAKKINIKIKPIAHMTPSKVSASMDELRATVGTWKSMSNINLVKPNSRRSQYSIVQPPPPLPPKSQKQQPPEPLQLPIQKPPPRLLSSKSDTYLLPIALAVQECLNVQTMLNPYGENSTSLIGHIRMAVPLDILEIDSARFANNNLILNIITPKVWSNYCLNDQFVREQHVDEFPTNNNNNPSIKKIIVDMRMVHKYSKEYQRRPYILLPELLNYKIIAGSQTHGGLIDQSSCRLNPIKPVAHWLCDLSVTKVRIDFEHLKDELNACGLLPIDVTNIKISVQVDGGVESQQSKPPGVWSPIDSKLTWSFGDLDELMQASTRDGVTSCLAKFNLIDGPSTPDQTDIQFSIAGKTLSGTQMMLDVDSRAIYRIAKQKFQVKTGRFRCEPPVCEPPVLI